MVPKETKPSLADQAEQRLGGSDFRTATAKQEPVVELEAAAEAEPTPEPAPEPPTTRKYIEYVGEPPYGAEFVDKRVITRKQAKDGWSISIPKDLVWQKNRKGRMLLPHEDFTPEALEALAEEPGFKIVEEELLR